MSSYKPLPKHKPHDVIPSEEWNIISDDLEYLKSKVEEALVGKVKPSDLDAIDSPANKEVPTYNEAQGKFEWIKAILEKVLPSDLDAIDSPADKEVPTYNEAQGKFEWIKAILETVKPSDLDAIDSPADGEVPTYNEAQGKFEWKPMAAGAEVTVEDVLNKRFRGGALVKVFNHFIPAGMLDGDIDVSSIEWTSGYLYILMGAADQYAYLWAIWNHTLYSPTWDKKRRFFINLVPCEMGLGAYLHLVSGGIQDYTSPDNVSPHIGFKLIDGTLYGTVADGSAESTLNLGSVACGDPLFLEAILDVEEGKCSFYRDDVHQGDLTSNLPSGTTHADYAIHLGFRTHASDPPNDPPNGRPNVSRNNSVAPMGFIYNYYYIYEVGAIQYP